MLSIKKLKETIKQKNQKIIELSEGIGDLNDPVKKAEYDLLKAELDKKDAIITDIETKLKTVELGVLGVGASNEPTPEQLKNAENVLQNILKG